MSRIRDSYFFRGGIVLKLLKNDLNSHGLTIPLFIRRWK